MKKRIPTWLGLVLMLAALVVAAAISLVLERLTAPR